jgi:hypothetical protein
MLQWEDTTLANRGHSACTASHPYRKKWSRNATPNHGHFIFLQRFEEQESSQLLVSLFSVPFIPHALNPGNIPEPIRGPFQ